MADLSSNQNNLFCVDLINREIKDVDEDELLADPVKRHNKYLREREFTLEGILRLLQLGEKVGTVLKRIFMNNIHDVRQLFVTKQTKELEIAGVANKGQLTDAIRMDVDKAVKATLPKNIDYGVLRSTEEIKKMLQFMVNVKAKTVSCCINGSGQVAFPVGISVPKLIHFKVEFLSDVFSSAFPESIRVLWLCGSIPLGQQVCNLNGLTKLQVLVVSGCAIMSQAMETIPVSNELKYILTLCKSAENIFSTQVIIIPSGRYNGELATSSESYRKAMFLRRRGIVFAKGFSSFDKFAVCSLPDEIQEEYKEVKRSRSSTLKKVDF
uniref:F-box/LRR-repeat protein 2 n=1 Tax=Strongyloides venezuelensis TaxID=75913 RepID=A0A0K0FJ75_STRVS